MIFQPSAGALVYNAYIDGLMKGRNSQKALAIFDRMKRESCQPSTDTYTMLINLYGKVIQVVNLTLYMLVLQNNSWWNQADKFDL